MPPRARQNATAAPENEDERLDPAEQAMLDAETARLAAEEGAATPPQPPASVDDEGLDDDDDDLELPEDFDPDVYVALVDAVILKVGPKTGDTIRLGRGKLVRIEQGHKYIDLDYQLRIKALAPNDGQTKRRTTAKAMASAAGAHDDPVAVPASMIVKDATVVPDEAALANTG